MTRREEQGRYQMLWDCPACGSEGLLGLDHRFCPSCGSAQDPALRYYPSDDAKIAVEDHPYHGADRVCPACDTPNSAASGFCQACGSPLDDAKAAATRDAKVTAEGESFQGESGDDARAEAREKQREEQERRLRQMSGPDQASATSSADGSDGAPPRKKRGALLWGCGAVVALAVVGLGLFCLLSSMWAKSDDVVVEGHRWERAVQVEAFGPTKDSAWRDKVPSKARDVSCRKKENGSRKVADGETCKTVREDKGDGTFAEIEECKPKYKKEPIYDEWCDFVVDTWAVAKTEQAAGQDLKPRWPTVKVRGDKEREGKRTESLKVTVRDSQGTTHTCEVSQDRWRALEPGATVKASFGGITGLIDCGSLKP